MASIAKFETWQDGNGVNRNVSINTIQVITTATTYYSVGANVYTEMAAMTYTYAPISYNSKIMIHWNMHIGQKSDHSFNIRLNVNGTYPYLGNNGTGYQSSGPSMYFNNTSAVITQFAGTYIYQNAETDNVVLKLYGADQAGTWYINRGFSYDDSSRHRTPSTWIITEIQS